jgi:hypothetical protein
MTCTTFCRSGIEKDPDAYPTSHDASWRHAMLGPMAAM